MPHDEMAGKKTSVEEQHAFPGALGEKKNLSSSEEGMGNSGRV